MSPLLDVPEDKTANKKEAKKKKLSNLKEALQVKKDIAVKKAQKAYELFCCFVVGKVQTNWDRIVNEMHTKNLWVAIMAVPTRVFVCVPGFPSWTALSSTSSPSSLLTQLKSNVTTCSRRLRSPRESRQVSSCYAWGS